MLNCINEPYDGITFCMKCGEDEVTDFVEQIGDIRQGCSLSPYLFNILWYQKLILVKILYMHWQQEWEKF